MNNRKKRHIFRTKEKYNYNHSVSYSEGYTFKQIPDTDLMGGLLKSIKL